MFLRDHAGGNKQLKDMMPNLRFFGGDSRIDCLTTKVSHDTKLSIGQLSVTCLYTPCHTSGHICYYVTSNSSSDSNDKAVFTGKYTWISLRSVNGKNHCLRSIILLLNIHISMQFNRWYPFHWWLWQVLRRQRRSNEYIS